MVAKKRLKIKLIRGITKCIPQHKACVKGLGLRRLGHSVTVEDTPCTRGMINKVSYLVQIEQV
jgi:large subunit ribosomal protein L30